MQAFLANLREGILAQASLFRRSRFVSQSSFAERSIDGGAAMPSPFPGMDPYLERPDLWPDVHLELIRAIRAALTKVVAPRYIVAVEERTYIAALDTEAYLGRPDVAVLGQLHETHAPALVPLAAAPGAPLVVELPISEEVHERYLEVRTTGDQRVITVIEVLSPSNKWRGEGRVQYLRKRDQVLASQTHLVEIDLLRSGPPMPMAPLPRAPLATGGYRLLISRAPERPRAQLYAFGVRDPIPVFEVPLASGDVEPRLDLGSLLAEVYDVARYDLRVDYTSDPVPALGSDDAEWAVRRVREAGARRD